MDPQELLEKAKSGELRPEVMLNEWFRARQGMAPGSRRVYRAAVKKFFDINLPDLDFRWNRVEVGRMRKVETDRIPTKDVLLRMMNVGTIKARVVVSVLTSSGVRRGTLSQLKIKDLDLDRYPDVGVIRVPSELNKARISYVTFISPQAKKLTKEYLDVRRRRGHEIGPESMLIEHSERGVSPDAVGALWNKLLKRTGEDEKGRLYRVLRLHTARKYFATMLSAAGVDPSARERMLGHFAGFRDPNLAQDGAYYRPYEEQLLDEYRKAVTKLTIAEEVGTEEFRKKQAMDALKMLGYPEEKLKKVENLLAKARSLDDVLDEVRKLTSSDQKIVDQSELDEYLATGWEPVMRLENKKIVIKRSAGI
jgi:site-specific recombinase XerC